MSGKARVYCINHECSKKHICARHMSRPLPDMLTRCYMEYWNKKSCEKYVPTAGEVPQPAYIMDDQPHKHTGRIQDPGDIELREYLVRLVTDNFDELFMRELAWRNGLAYNIPQIAARVVDLVMPVMKRNAAIRKKR